MTSDKKKSSPQEKERTPEQKRQGEAPEGEGAEYPGHKPGVRWDHKQAKDTDPKRRP